MNRFHYILFGASAIAMASLSSCTSTDDAAMQAPTHEVNMTVVLAKDGGAESRTAFAEVEGSLACTWTSGDRVVVAKTDGTKLGTLALKEGEEGKSEATFEGKLTVEGTGTQKMNFIYLGNATNADDAESPLIFNYANQTGTMAGLSDYDFFSQSADVDVNFTEANTTVDGMERRIAFAHFKLSFPEGVAASTPVTVSGSNLVTSATISLNNEVSFSGETGTISTAADANGDLYLTILPGTTDLTFTATVGETEYKCTLPEREWKANEYVRKKNDDGTFGGVAVEMTAPVVEPVIDETVVGPVFEVNGRKFRFTKANLAYNVPEKRWYLLDEQYSFLCKKGWASADGRSNAASEKDIDLFGFGCTGLHFSYYNDRLQKPTQFEEDINAPEYFVREHITSTTKIDGTGQGYYYPTQNATCNEGYVGSNLEFGIQGFTMDWGVAYGQQEGKEGYFTLLSSEWSELQKNYYMCGATITDIQNTVTGKKGIYGCLILDAKDGPKPQLF